jgi:F-type H+-transporting ATPase subunit delta
MHDKKVAKRYATALYKEAVRNDVISSVEADLDAITALISSATQFKDFLMSPHVGREEKIRIADKLFSDRVTALTMQFIRLLLEKRREAEFDAIREEFTTLRRANSNVIFAEVTSAMALDQAHREALEMTLAEKSGKRVEAVYDVDPSLIGGLRVAYGEYVLDGTVKGSLRRLSDTLKHDLLKEA